METKLFLDTTLAVSYINANTIIKHELIFDIRDLKIDEQIKGVHILLHILKRQVIPIIRHLPRALVVQN